MSQSADEIRDLAASLVPVLQTSVRVTVRILLEAQEALGEEPNPSEAYALASIHSILGNGESIDALVADGMSRRTAYRRRARLRELLAAADDDVQDRAASDVFGTANVLLARQLVETANTELSPAGSRN